MTNARAIDPRHLRAAVWALLALGLALRFWAIDHARFTGDEGDYWAKSRLVAEGRYTPVYGPEITGSEAQLPGPAYYYLMAVPQAFGASPRWGSAFVVLLHGLTGWLLFLLASRARGARAGLLALLLWVAAPWDVLYGDRIWGSCVVPVWGSLAVFAAMKSETSPHWQGALLFLCAVLPQLHLSVPVLWLACLVILILRRPQKIGWASLGAGLVLSVVAYFPPLLSELQNGFANTKTILAKSGGDAPFSDAILIPLKVFGYAVAYASSEVGYHFARGYWGGNFDDLAAYGTAAGWARWWTQHGALLGALGVISILLAMTGWASALMVTARATISAARARVRPDAGTVLTLGLLAGFGGGALLMMMAKKTFFPHYANILMPIALWPAVMGLDALLDRPRLRVAIWIAVPLAVASMAANTVRYYLSVDSLNGLGPTLQMVDRVSAEPGPVAVEFAHFHNLYTWGRVADVLYHRPLNVQPKAAVRYRVLNGRPFEGQVPEGGTVHGPVLLQRIPASGNGIVIRTKSDWKRWQVSSITPEGAERACAPISGRDACAYGDQPWEHFGPEAMDVGGTSVPLLFMHPIQDRVVRATYPTGGASSATLLYALTDGATRSTNLAPVELIVRQGDAEVARASAGNRPGMVRLPLTLSPLTEQVTVEITTTNAGARVFGFDLEL